MELKVASKAATAPLRFAVRAIFVPLSRVLQRFGVSYSEASEALLKGYVEAAQDHLVEMAEKPTHSRVALLTGISRQKVATVLVQRASSAKPMPKAQILEAWLSDPRYRGKDGRPLDLPFKGFRSFSQLCASCTSNFGPKTALDEFEAMGNVEVLPNGMIRLVNTTVIPADGIERAAAALRNVSRHLATIQHNVVATRDKVFQERFSWSWQLPPARSGQALEEMQKLAARADRDAKELLGRLESEINIEQDTVGLGSYVFFKPKD